MSDAETEKFYLVIEDPPKRRSAPWVKMVAGFIVCVTLVRLVPFVTWHSVEQENGDRISVMSVWSQSVSYVHGDPPNWQRETHEDGTVLEGALKNGHKNSRWVVKRNGSVIKTLEFWDGEIVDEAVPQQEAQ